MRKSPLKFALGFAATFISFGVSAQNDLATDNHTITISIPEVAIVDIEPAATKNITLGYTAPTEAGNPVLPPTANTSLWLNYSSIKSVADPTRTVSVKLTALIPGVDIKVTAANATGSGGGTTGTGSTKTLTAVDQILISGIGSAYTGNGASNGHNLTYELVSVGGVASYADLQASAGTAATVNYTISDN